MLIDAAIAWVRANCPDAKLRADLTQKLKDAMQRQLDCWFGVGPVLTRERAPYLIHCFAGELFIFQLTPQQATAILPAPNALASSLDERASDLNRRADPVIVAISDLSLDRPTLTPREPVTGSFAYEVQGELPAEYCLRLDYHLGLPDDVGWYHPEQILSSLGQLRFAFPPLADSAWPSVCGHRGPVALFLRVCDCSRVATDDPRARPPISNTCGALVQIV